MDFGHQHYKYLFWRISRSASRFPWSVVAVKGCVGHSNTAVILFPKDDATIQPIGSVYSKCR